MHEMDRQSDKHGSKDDNLPGMQDRRYSKTWPRCLIKIRHRWRENT